MKNTSDSSTKQAGKIIPHQDDMMVIVVDRFLFCPLGSDWSCTGVGSRQVIDWQYIDLKKGLFLSLRSIFWAKKRYSNGSLVDRTGVTGVTPRQVINWFSLSKFFISPFSGAKVGSGTGAVFFLPFQPRRR